MKKNTIFILLVLCTLFENAITPFKQSRCHLFAAEINQNIYHKRISVIGTGYVGLVLGAGLAEWGHHVICADILEDKIRSLQNNVIPFYEPGLDELVKENVIKDRLSFTSDIVYAIQSSDIIFIAVGTPSNPDGSADITAVEAVAATIGQNLNGDKIVCLKSTVPIGTSRKIQELIKSNIDPNKGFNFQMTFNPEFLREGSALMDFVKTDRFVVGGDDLFSVQSIKDVFYPLIKSKTPCIETSLESAEAIKYATNAFLATKISFMNEFANLCDETGADISIVAQGMGLDKRIGPAFLNPGPGYGGSCFPKDTLGLIYLGRELGIDLKVVQAAVEANHVQMSRVVAKLKNFIPDLAGKNIAILGLAFKAKTDDIRCSPAITVAGTLLSEGAKINAYDPMAMNNMKKILPELNYCNSADQAVQNADAVIILTEWDEFKDINLLSLYQRMNLPILIDTRNLYDPQELSRIGFMFDNTGGPKK